MGNEMAGLRTHILAGFALALVPAAALMAQDSTPATPPAEEITNEIIVEGYTEKEVRQFLWRALIDTGNVLAKRIDPVCIGIDNAPDDLAKPLRARIEANLASLDIPRGEPGCKVNAVIVFDRDAHGFVNWLADQDAGIAYASLYLPERRRLIKPVRPAYNWHFLKAGEQERPLGKAQSLTQQGAEGGRGFQAAEFGPGGRILANTFPAETGKTFSVVDFDAIDGITIEQLGDYLTMQMLVELRPGANSNVPADSILTLFTDTGNNPDAPPEMSALDRTILAEIYGGSDSYRVGAVRNSIARAAIDRLGDEGALKAEP
jgi:hypothetical protein